MKRYPTPINTAAHTKSSSVNKSGTAPAIRIGPITAPIAKPAFKMFTSLTAFSLPPRDKN